MQAAFSEGSITPGTYRYGLINFARPFKVKGSIQVGSTTLNTCGKNAAGYQVTDNGQTGLNIKQTVKVTDLSTCTKESVAVMQSNGGTLFRIAGGYTVEEGKSYVADLAFNPVGFISAATDSTSGVTASDLSNTAGTQMIAVPFVDFSPVIRETTQKTYKMVYVSDNNELTGTGSSFSVKMRLELYFAGSSEADAATATIQGINFNTLKPTTGSNSVYNASGSSMVNTRAGSVAGDIEILNYKGEAVISGLSRSIASGATDTATINLANLGIVGGATDYSATFTLESISEVK